MESTWIPIFKTGSYKQANGISRTFTEADLDAIVSNYEPRTRETPLVFGSPKMEDPAYGWVRAFKREGHRLLASFKQIVPEVIPKLRDGLYRIKSVAFLPGGSLRHISFTGDTPPVLSGLKAVFDFCEADAYEFFEYEPEFDGYFLATLTNKV